MKALTPFEASPRITPETARELVEWANKAGYLAAITVHVWVKVLDKEVTNEVDAQDSIKRLNDAVASGLVPDESATIGCVCYERKG